MESYAGTLTWYTDGSLDEERCKAGCAAVNAFEAHQAASFTSRPGTLSSTSAELGAIYLALKNSPPNQEVLIFPIHKLQLALPPK